MHTIESSIQKYRIELLLFVIFKAIRRSLITKTRIFKKSRDFDNNNFPPLARYYREEWYTRPQHRQKKKKKESQIQNASRRTLWTILKIIGERHLKSENIKGTHPSPYTGIIKQDEMAKSISSMKRELNLSPSPPSILLGTFMPLFHWLRDPLKPASVLKLFFFFFFSIEIFYPTGIKSGWKNI